MTQTVAFLTTSSTTGSSAGGPNPASGAQNSSNLIGYGGLAYSTTPPPVGASGWLDTGATLLSTGAQLWVQQGVGGAQAFQDLVQSLPPGIPALTWNMTATAATAIDLGVALANIENGNYASFMQDVGGMVGGVVGGLTGTTLAGPVGGAVGSIFGGIEGQSAGAWVANQFGFTDAGSVSPLISSDSAGGAADFGVTSPGWGSTSNGGAPYQGSSSSSNAYLDWNNYSNPYLDAGSSFGGASSGGSPYLGGSIASPNPFQDLTASSNFSGGGYDSGGFGTSSYDPTSFGGSSYDSTSFSAPDPVSYSPPDPVSFSTSDPVSFS